MRCDARRAIADYDDLHQKAPWLFRTVPAIREEPFDGFGEGLAAGAPVRAIDITSYLIFLG
jgi:hypothetical protein